MQNKILNDFKNSLKLSDIYNHKENSFDLLRFLLATCVLYTHSYFLLLGKSAGNLVPLVSFSNNQLGLGSLAVYGFFIISGFFITQSFLRSKTIWHYLKKRLLRLFPALFVSLFFITFIIVPLVSEISLDEYFKFQQGSPLYFFTNSLFLHIFDYSTKINGVFTMNPFPQGLNGSMWTLKHEFASYLLMPLVLYFTYNKRKWILFMFVLLFCIVFVNIVFKFQLFELPRIFWVLNNYEYKRFIILFTFFMAGSLINLYSDVIVVSKRLFFLALIGIFVTIHLGGLKLMLLVTLPYIIIVFGSVFKRKLFTKYGDFSYGMYIYAFPIQQTISYFWEKSLTVSTFFIISFILTLAFSVLSWNLIEKKALKFKMTK